MARQVALSRARNDQTAAKSAAGGRPSLAATGVVILTVFLALIQLLIWIKAIETRGGPEYYVRGIDLMPTLAASVAIRNGDGGSLYDFGTQLAAQRQVRAPYLTTSDDQLLPFIHPPFEALLIAPFLELPYGLIYGVLSALALGAVVASCWRLARDLPIGGAGRWVLLAAIWSYHPLYQALWLGQTSPFVLLGICGTYAALKRRREIWAALPLLLIALKPQVCLVFVLLILLLGHWRTVMVAAAVGVAACIAAIPFLGLLWPLHYASFLGAIAGWDVPHAVYPASMPTLRGLTVNLLNGAAPALVSIVAALLASLALGGLVWSWWRARPYLGTKSDPDTQRLPLRDCLWALAGVVAVLVPAHMGPHDHTILIFPAWIIARHTLAGGWRTERSRIWYGLLWGVYCAILLLPVATSTAIVVVPTVTLLIGVTVALLWTVGLLTRATRPTGATLAMREGA